MGDSHSNPARRTGDVEEYQITHQKGWFVPELRSDNDKGFIITASSVYSSDYAAWNAFDGNDRTFWYSSSPYQGWIEVEFPIGRVCNRVRIKPKSKGCAPKRFRIE